jgi:sulfhydrogenase subunit beta (sulfur reductase)
MAKDCYLLSSEGLLQLVEKLMSDAVVVAPIEKSGAKHFTALGFEDIEKIDLSGWRCVENIKAHSFKPAETVSTYFQPQPEAAGQKVVIIGARGCDLEGVEVLDRVFAEGEFPDGFYRKNRANIMLIGADCTACGRSCFCNLMKGTPYPTKLFDLNLSLTESGYLVEIGSEKGEEIVEANKFLFRPASSTDIEERKRQRERMTEQLDEQNRVFNIKHDLSQSHKINLENKAWKGLTRDCVECSACNFICPTCSCFLLTDGQADNCFQRDRVWDACLKTGYTRVAGGANPRGQLYQRLQNRYHCKCDYSYDRLGRYTCVGCGRCIDGCAGNIDMRKIYAELERLAPLTAKLE